MANLNQVTLMGYLGQDPEVRTMPNGTAVANLSVATSKSWTDAITGEKREKTEWHRVVVFKRQAEVAGQYLRKGSNVFVQGELVYKKWTDKQNVEHTTAEIQANLLQMLGGNTGQRQATSAPAPQSQPQQAPVQGNAPPAPADDFSDIPF